MRFGEKPILTVCNPFPFSYKYHRKFKSDKLSFFSSDFCKYTTFDVNNKNIFVNLLHSALTFIFIICGNKITPMKKLIILSLYI